MPPADAPQPLPTQMSLFTVTLDELVEQTGVSEPEMREWHAAGLLSFSPDDAVRFEPFDVAELLFLAALMRSGLGRPQIDALLAGLPKPYRYDPESTGYNFHTRRWQQVAPPVEPDFQDELETFIDHAVRTGDIEALHGALRRLRDAIAEVRGRWSAAS